MRKYKNEQLGENPGTATHKLRKNLMFHMAKQLNLLKCYRCGKDIEDAHDLSLDHKIAWLHTANPRELFFDLDNLAFSHKKCNIEGKRSCNSVVKASCGFKGVSFCPKNKSTPYQAAAGNKYLGKFSTPEEAALAYDLAAENMWGENAITNKSLGLI